MSTAEALKLVRSACEGNATVDPDVLNFGAVSGNDVLLALRAAEGCEGEGSVFRVHAGDLTFTVVIHGEEMTVIGMR